VRVTLGIDLGGTQIKAGLVGEDGQVIWQDVRPTPAAQGPNAVIGVLKSCTSEAASHAQETGLELLAGGIALPGLLDDKTGISMINPNFLDWRNVDIAAGVGTVGGRRVRMVNDVNAAALGEWAYGAGQGADNLFMVALGTGVGSGLVLNHALYTGSHGGAGEFGHIPIDPHGPVCGCGRRGCLETYVSATGIMRRTRELMPKYPDSVMWRRAEGDISRLTAADLSAAAEQGDDLAGFIWDETGEILGRALAIATDLLDVDLVILGGGVLAAGDLLLKPTLASLNRSCFVPAPTVLPAKLGNWAGVVGTARFAADYYQREGGV
jgi:glucokinase